MYDPFLPKSDENNNKIVYTVSGEELGRPGNEVDEDVEEEGNGNIDYLTGEDIFDFANRFLQSKSENITFDFLIEFKPNVDFDIQSTYATEDVIILPLEKNKKFLGNPKQTFVFYNNEASKRYKGKFGTLHLFFEDIRYLL